MVSTFPIAGHDSNPLAGEEPPSTIIPTPFQDFVSAPEYFMEKNDPFKGTQSDTCESDACLNFVYEGYV